MAKRRSLGDSLDDDFKPQEASFYHTGQANAAITNRSVANVPEPLSTEQLLAVLPAFPDNALAPLNVRVHPDIARALMRASMVRKFQQQQPWSQKDIVSEALEDWLRKNAYLK